MKKNNKETANEILQRVKDQTKGLLSTNLGTNKTSIYKETCFEDCTEREKKSLRKKFRNVLFSIAKSLVIENNETNKNQLINAFNDFYTSTYSVNDYTLSSICNENLANEKKEILSKALEICKK